MNPVDIIGHKLCVPRHYTQPVGTRNNRIIILVHHNWLSQFLKSHSVPTFITHENLSSEEVEAALLQNRVFAFPWQRVLVQIIEKAEFEGLALPLQRPRTNNATEDAGLSFPQLLHYVSHTNYKNLWKHHFKKYSGTKRQGLDVKGVAHRKSLAVLKEILIRLYGSPIIDLSRGEHIPKNNEFGNHINILSAEFMVETESYIFALHPLRTDVTLKDYVTFSPSVFSNNINKPMFIIYQLLQVLKDTHDRALILGDIRLDDIYISQDLFIQVIPVAVSNVFFIAPEHIIPKSIPRSPTDDSLATLCQRWTCGDLSNYEYLMHLNVAAGRRYGNPACHFVLPWVSDLSTRSSGPWRDLTRSKFRINKGDRQLDITYDNVSSSQIPHHVTDVLSEITYYVYLSRRTPRSVLCRYVRSSWVPAEYPSSIQRLQAWTPDECIPEFFTDPSIFKSLHEDLCDLQVPPWAQTPEEFIIAHREQLESKRVSEKLHHWIDLTFGYKLCGPAAVKAKNVCLHLASGHRNLSSSGVVQVFKHPHPKRQTHCSHLDRQPPKALKPRSPAEDDGARSSDNDEDENADVKSSSPLLLHRFLSLSRNSLLAPFHSSSDEGCYKSSGTSSTSTTGAVSGSCFLPNPLGLLNSVENVHNFHWKTFGTGPPTIQPSFSKSGPKQLAAVRRMQEMQILGCLLMEIFLYSQMRIVQTKTVEERIEACCKLLKSENLPHCIRPAVSLLLDKTGAITQVGLPPPSAHQMLQPLLSSFLIPFPVAIAPLYASISRLRMLQVTEEAVNFSIQLFSHDLDHFLDERTVDLVFPFVKELLTNSQTSLLTVSLLLDKMLRYLGVKRTNELLTDTFLDLYERNSTNCFLYQRRFVLLIMIRCGLHVFLNHFIVLIIEAVGRISPHTILGGDVCEDCDSSPEAEEHKVAVKELSPEVGIFMFDREDTPSDGESLQNLMEHLTATSDDEEGDPPSDVEKELNIVRSPPIPVTCRGGWTDKMTVIECEVGSKGEDFTNCLPIRTFDEMAAPAMDSGDKEKVHEVAADSILWLSRRLGPVLTAKYISRNLLKMLTLCYTGPVALSQAPPTSDGKCSISQFKVVGDENAATVLKCLAQLIELYGEQFILLQYLPFMSELIAVSKKKLSFSVEGGAVGSLALLQYIVPYLNDSTLMDNLQDIILKNVIHPLIRLMVSTRYPFPSGSIGRLCLASKLLDTLYFLSIHIGAEMTRVHLAVPSLQRFFLAFDKAADIRPEAHEVHNHSDLFESMDTTPLSMFAELRKVFNSQLAHSAYLLFFRLLGKQTMENALVNHELVRRLCLQYEHQFDPLSSSKQRTTNESYLGDLLALDEKVVEKGGSGSFGSNIAVIGNKIELHGGNGLGNENGRTTNFTENLFKDNSRHLRGNWLAYWEHEIGRSEKDARFNFKQIKLQTFSSHGNAIRTLIGLDNENSFISGSRDKTVKLWCIRNQGDGSSVCSNQFTYSSHRKSILAAAYLSGPRLIASCDSTVHIWDPFIGRTIAILDTARSAPCSLIRAYPTSGFSLVAATTESTIRVVDSRTASSVAEFKISWNSAGLIRSMCLSEEAEWIAVGQSTGFITVLDLRTGLVISAWKGHEGEVLQLTAVSRDTLLSSSLDHTVAVWNINDGKIKFHLKGPTEPVHCLQTHGSEVISATTANRIGVHAGIDPQAGFSSVKLRSETLKGVLTSMALLPLNMQLLVGADNGHITLLC